MQQRGGILEEVDPRIVEYLRKHRGKHDIDVLKKALVKAGHPHEHVELAEEMLDEDEIHSEPAIPFPDPVFDEIKKEAREWKKEKKAEKKLRRGLDKVEMMLLALMVVLVGLFVYIILI